MPDPHTDRTSYGEALASGEFRTLLTSQLLEVGGISVAAVALTVLVYERTRSPLLASLTFALNFLPYLLGGSLLSAVVDIVRPRRLVVLCDFTAGLIMAVIALPGLPLPALFALLLTIGALSSMSSGARAALTRATVTERAYVPARSLLRISSQLAQIGGNAGGGALLLLISPRGSLLIDTGALLLGSLLIRFRIADHPNDGHRGERTVWRDSLDGARTIFGHPELRRLILVGWFSPMFSVAPEALAAPYVSSHHGSASLVGWWLVALPVGLIASDIAGVRLLSATQQRRVLGPAVIAGFVPYLAFALSPPIAIAIALLVASGAMGMYTLGLDARIRDAAPPGLFPRTMTLFQSGMMALQGIGFALAGAVAQAVGPAAAVAIAGVCGLTVTAWLMRRELAGIAPQRPDPRPAELGQRP